MWEFHQHSFINELEILILNHSSLADEVQEVELKIVQVFEMLLFNELRERTEPVLSQLFLRNKPFYLFSFFVYFLIVVMLQIEKRLVFRTIEQVANFGRFLLLVVFFLRHHHLSFHRSLPRVLRLRLHLVRTFVRALLSVLVVFEGPLDQVGTVRPVFLAFLFLHKHMNVIINFDA